MAAADIGADIGQAGGGWKCKCKQSQSCRQTSYLADWLMLFVVQIAVVVVAVAVRYLA